MTIFLLLYGQHYTFRINLGDCGTDFQHAALLAPKEALALEAVNVYYE